MAMSHVVSTNKVFLFFARSRHSDLRKNPPHQGDGTGVEVGTSRKLYPDLDFKRRYSLDFDFEKARLYPT